MSRCYICDKIMSPTEMKIHPITRKQEPCLDCFEVIKECFAPDPDEMTEEELAEDAFNLDLEDFDERYP